MESLLRFLFHITYSTSNLNSYMESLDAAVGIKIFFGMPESKPKVEVWLVPSDSILAQTIRTLSDVNHD